MQVKKTKKILFYFFGARQGLTLLLCISIHNKKSGSRSSS